MNLRALSLLTPLVLLALTTGAPLACTSALPITDAACPCATGWSCCEADDRCVESLADECPTAAKTANTTLNVELAKDQTPRCITQDATQLYWMNADGKIASLPKSGGSILPSRFPVPQQVVSECALVIDDGYLYATMDGLGTIARVCLLYTSRCV